MCDCSEGLVCCCLRAGPRRRDQLYIKKRAKLDNTAVRRRKMAIAAQLRPPLSTTFIRSLRSLPLPPGPTRPYRPITGSNRAPAQDSNARRSARPSHDPRSSLLARSGWGINPTALPLSLPTPAMSRTEPLGLAIAGWRRSGGRYGLRPPASEACPARPCNYRRNGLSVRKGVGRARPLTDASSNHKKVMTRSPALASYGVQPRVIEPERDGDVRANGVASASYLGSIVARPSSTRSRPTSKPCSRRLGSWGERASRTTRVSTG